MIEIKNLDKYYSRGRSNEVHAVNNISLTLPDKGMIAVFGKSGCGKTTLLNIIGGLDRAQKGEVMLDGKKISPDEDRERNLSVGYIFQNYNLQKNLTVYENVAVSLRLCGLEDEGEIEKRVMAALRGVDMDKYRNRLPDTLSGGQQQRIAIARAIVKNPKLILADEPTGNLDEHNTVMVMDMLKEISKEHLVLLVTHEADLVDLYCDKVIEIVDGGIESTRENAVTEGFTGRGSNEVFLGDMEKHALSDREMSVEYFGDSKDLPSQIKLISFGGALYIKAEGPLRLRLLDNTAEIKINEGKYEEREKRETRSLEPCLSEPFDTGKTGRMYNFRGAVKTGWRANFGKTKKGKKLLVFGLGCFAVVIVIMVAIFGVTFAQMQDIESYYSQNVISLKPDGVDSEYIESLISSGKADNILFTRTYADLPYSLRYYQFCIGNFETFKYDYNLFFGDTAYPLPSKAMSGRLICGKGEIESDREIIITSAFADRLLEVCSVGYVEDYEDLLYIACGEYGWRDNIEDRYVVVGIVEDAESAVYLSDYEYLSEMIAYGAAADISHYDGELEPLEDGYVYFNLNGNYAYSDKERGAGDKLTLNGVTFTIKDIIESERPEVEFGEEFDNYVYKIYGAPVHKDLSEYLLYFYGCDLSDYDQWLEYVGKDIADPMAYFEQELAVYTKEYTYFCQQIKQDYEQSVGMAGEPTLIMTLNDIFRVIASNGESEPELSGIFNNYSGYMSTGYLIHSDTPEELTDELVGRFGESAVFAAEDMYEYYSSDYTEGFIILTIMLVVVTAVMSVCLFLIMRSALMSDIKEIGISRAIGVSKKNLVYRYFVETGVLFVLTIFVGYILTSAVIWGLMAVSSMTESVIYYPVWLALITLAGLLVVSIVCGLIPIRSLLRRSPAEILAKYDI